MKSIISKFKKIIGTVIIKTTTNCFHNKDNGCIGKIVYVLYSYFLCKLNMSIMKVLNADEYFQRTHNVKIKIIEYNRCGCTSEVVYLGSSKQTITHSFPISDLSLLCFSDVYIRGNSDIVVDKARELVISEVAFNLDPNEEVIDGLIYRTRNNLCVLRDNFQKERIDLDSGIMISGKFCKNYYHILYENLIKLVYLHRLDIPSSVPILVDSDTMNIQSCKRIFEILTEGCRREVIRIDSNKLYHVHELYSLSRVNILPANWIDINKPIKIIYSPSALKLMRQHLIKYRSKNMFSKRVFVSRNGNGRNYNEDEVFKVLMNYNFECISPELMPIEDQIALYHNADYIVSGSGAALANLLFINEKCTVICLGLGSYDNLCDVPIFNTIASINSANFMFFPRKKGVKDDIHVNYEIDCEDFYKKMEILINGC